MAVGARYDDGGKVVRFLCMTGTVVLVSSRFTKMVHHLTTIWVIIALNGAGDRLGIGSYNSNRTYCYSFNGSSWSQMGSVLSGSTWFGWSVDMNDAGDVIAVLSHTILAKEEELDYYNGTVLVG